MRYSKSRDYDTVVRIVVATDDWEFEPKGRRKHPILIHRLSRNKVPVPFSPSCSGRGLKNFKSQLIRLDSRLKELI